MRKTNFIFIVLFSLFLIVSCGSDADSCEQNEDCGNGFTCDQNAGECVPENGGNTDETSDGGNHEGENPGEGNGGGNNNNNSSSGSLLGSILGGVLGGKREMPEGGQPECGLREVTEEDLKKGK